MIIKLQEAEAAVLFVVIRRSVDYSILNAVCMFGELCEYFLLIFGFRNVPNKETAVWNADVHLQFLSLQFMSIQLFLSSLSLISVGVGYKAETYTNTDEAKPHQCWCRLQSRNLC